MRWSVPRLVESLPRWEERGSQVVAALVVWEEESPQLVFGVPLDPR